MNFIICELYLNKTIFKRIVSGTYKCSKKTWHKLLPPMTMMIAGDDTVFVAMENAEGVKAFLKRFKDH